MKKDVRIHLAFILECIDLIEKYVGGVSFDFFMGSAQLQDAVIRRIELIGEAVRNVPQEIQAGNPGIPWSRIAGMRNILVHDYLGIDLKTAWNVATKEIPVLKKQISGLKKKL